MYPHNTFYCDIIPHILYLCHSLGSIFSCLKVCGRSTLYKTHSLSRDITISTNYINHCGKFQSELLVNIFIELNLTVD